MAHPVPTLLLIAPAVGGRLPARRAPDEFAARRNPACCPRGAS